MASKVQICNMALSKLGSNTITSLTDGTAEAILCNTFFEDLAKRVMVQGSWTSTIRRATLAQTTTTPTYEYTYEYQLPVGPKCLKVLDIDEEVPGTISYRIEGDKLLTDDTSVKLRYIAYLTNSDDYGSLLTEAIESLLASYLCIPITGNSQLAMAFKQEYIEILNNNLAVDGQQGDKPVISTTDLIEVR